MGKKTIEEMWNANPHWRRHPIKFVSMVVREVIGEDIEYNAGTFRYADEWNKCKKEQRQRAKKLGIKI